LDKWNTDYTSKELSFQASYSESEVASDCESFLFSSVGGRLHCILCVTNRMNSIKDYIEKTAYSLSNVV